MFVGKQCHITFPFLSFLFSSFPFQHLLYTSRDEGTGALPYQRAVVRLNQGFEPLKTRENRNKLLLACSK